MGLYDLITNAPPKQNNNGTYTTWNGNTVDANGNSVDSNGSPISQQQRLQNVSNQLKNSLAPVQNNMQGYEGPQISQNMGVIDPSQYVLPTLIARLGGQ